MKRSIFLTFIIVCSSFFIILLVIDEEYVRDRAIQQIYEGALLAILLGFIGVMASKYYGDVTAYDTIRELTKVISELEKKIEKLSTENRHKEDQ